MREREQTSEADVKGGKTSMMIIYLGREGTLSSSLTCNYKLLLSCHSVCLGKIGKKCRNGEKYAQIVIELFALN